VLLLLQEENAEEKDRQIEMTARLRENSEISKSGTQWGVWGERATTEQLPGPSRGG